MYPDVKLAAILKSIPENQNFSLLQKTLEKILKISREHLEMRKLSNFLR